MTLNATGLQHIFDTLKVYMIPNYCWHVHLFDTHSLFVFVRASVREGSILRIVSSCWVR